MNSEAVETSLCTTADRLERIEAALRLDFLDNHRQFQQSVDTGKEQQTGTSMSSSASTSSPPLTDQPPPFPLETLERLRRLQREWTELKERHEVVAAGKRDFEAWLGQSLVECHKLTERLQQETGVDMSASLHAYRQFFE